MHFSLSSFDLSTVSITGLWSIADAGSLELNGNVVAPSLSFSGKPWSSLHSFSVTNQAFLNQGDNVFTMTVTASDGAFEAARFEGSVTGSPIVPEPSTALLLAAGIVGLAVRCQHEQGASVG
jgi:hypothetical protein